ncbi:MAG: DUF58 domain-containing protein, partial [Halobacteria archaeon]|nr:DUF58 domain-containing protein [Halobacteria archaeon]
QNKFEYAAKIGLGYCYLAASENNDFRFSTFRDTFERLDTGASNRGEIMRLIELLNEREPQGEADFETALEDYSSQIKSRSLVLVVSDFIGDEEEIEAGIEALSENYLTLARVLAPEERKIPASGDTIFENIETGIELRTYLSNRLRSKYQENIEDHIDTVEEHAEDHRANHVLVDTGEEFFDSFAKAWVE